MIKVCNSCEIEVLDHAQVPVKVVRDDLLPIYSLIEDEAIDISSEAAIEEAEKKSSVRKGLVYADIDRNVVRCFSCDESLFSLRSICQHCPTFEHVTLWDNKATETEDRMEALIARAQLRVISQQICLQCAIQKHKNDPLGRMRHLQGYFEKET